MISDTQRIYAAAQLLGEKGKVGGGDAKTKMLLIADNAHQLQSYKQLLDFFAPDKKVVVLPDREILPYDTFSPPANVISERIGAFYRLLNDDYDLLMVTVDTLMQRTAPVSHFVAQGLFIKKDKELDREDFIRRLAESGYEICERVRTAGQYAVRGSLLDLFPTGAPFPYRLDWLDNKVETIRSFSPKDQRSLENIKSVNLRPPNEFPLTDAARQRFAHNWQHKFGGEARQHSFYKEFRQGGLPRGAENYLPLFFAPEKCGSLFDYITASDKIKMLGVQTENTGKLATACLNYASERYGEIRKEITKGAGKLNAESILPVQELYLTEAEFKAGIKNCVLPTKEEMGLSAKTGLSAPKTSKQERDEAARQLIVSQKKKAGERLLLAVNSSERFELMKTELAEIDHQVVTGWDEFRQGKSAVCLTHACIDGGLCNAAEKWTLLTEAELFAVSSASYAEEEAQHVRKNLHSVIEDLTQIRQGDPLVHLDYGVGIFRGLRPSKPGEPLQEFVCMEYADSVLLYTPVNNLHLIVRYAGIDGKDRKPDKLGSAKWNRNSTLAMKRIVDTAAELLSLYAERSARSGMITARPDKDYHEFAAGFPYVETPDQKDTIRDIIKDMEAEKTMDRLVCGDVGFGKTEVAMRAAYLAVAQGYQVAVLVPTTLLASQHLERFKDRFAGTAVNSEGLTRLSGNLAPIHKKIASGECDIIIGTHALLSDKVRFKNIGLLIIDEEHRFGVRQKEKIKRLRVNLDVLSLTATPIPRTLNMAISGLRDISLIASPPKDRLAVKTFFCSYDERLRRDAINRELRRGGQVYYVYNRIPRIPEMVAELQKIFPDTVCAGIYGGMPKAQIEGIMNDFYNNRIGILVCTTIIENGIDVPNANTMILERADKFGLAQLHQLRGRIGRRESQAYAYLMTEGTIGQAARKKLNALTEAQELGMGFMLASHDMQIRGAGDILSAEQSGDVQRIGMDLYSKLLERTIHNLRQGKNIKDTDLVSHITMDAAISAILPEEYIHSPYERLSFYRRIAGAKGGGRNGGNGLNGLDQLRDELTDRFGPLPAEVENLFALQQLKTLAEELGIVAVRMNRGGGYLEAAADSPLQHALKSAAQTDPNAYTCMKSRLRIREGFTTEAECIQRIEDALKLVKSQTAVHRTDQKTQQPDGEVQSAK